MSMLSALITVAAVVWMVGISVVILMQRRSAAATMAWLLALSFLPIIGLVVYRLFGPLRLERKRLKRRVGRGAVSEALASLAELGRTSDELAQLARVSISLGGSPPLGAHGVTLYTDGVATYAAIAKAIGEARHHIHVEYYIWSPDAIGTRMRDLLCARARAGVKVRVVLDGMGAKACKKAFLAPFAEAGVELAWFNPIRLRGLRLRRPDFRSHRKIVICDGRVGFTGGMNITNEHSAEFTPDYWRDTHLRFEGPAVWALQRLFLDDWYFASERLPKIVPEFFPSAPDVTSNVPANVTSNMAPDVTSNVTPDVDNHHILQVVGSGPDTSDFAIQRTLFTAIGQAQRRLWITTPYFVPDEAILTALVAAGLRRVDVRLIIPEKGDSRLVDLAARSYIPELLAAGVRVFEYGPRFVHAKTLVVDDDLAVVGTANLDNRSFRLNFELIAVIFGAALNGQLAAAFAADLMATKELARDGGRPTFWTRLGQSGARLLSPLL
ncbi:MAG: cardiolipin synthase [Myxococcota bacterium]